MNEMELGRARESKTLHGNAKRVYPFWKVCQICQSVYPTHDRYQATRSKTCSPACNALRLSGPRPSARKPMSKRAGRNVACSVCGTETWRPNAWLRRVSQPTCSRACNGKLRALDLVKHSHKGRSGWTETSRKSYLDKMSGPKNPAWRGGVTKTRAKGNYRGAVCVRCPPEFAAMARKNGYVAEHRLVVAQALGRCLTRAECVHHMNHDPWDNRPENLALFRNNREHKLYESHGSPGPIWLGSKKCTTKE